MKINQTHAEFLLLSLLWGSSFIVIRYAVPYFGTVPLVFFRTFFAGMVLLPFLWRKKQAISLIKHWKILCIIGFFQSAFPFSLIAFASLTITSGVAAFLNACTPLAASVLAFFFLQQKTSVLRIIGLLIGITGVLFFVWEENFSLSDPTRLISIGACILATFSYGVGATVSRKFGERLSSLTMATGSQVYASIILFTPFLFFYDTSITIPATAWVGVFLLAVASTSFAYILFYRILSTLGPVVATSVTFVLPFVATVLGVIVLNEVFHFSYLVGGMLIILGSLITLEIIR